VVAPPLIVRPVAVVPPPTVVDAVTKSPAKELFPVKPLLSVRRVEEAVPEMAPQVTLPFTTFKALAPVHAPVARKRLVVEALVAKKLVVVALVPVALLKVKFWRVVEARTMRLVVVAPPKMVSPPLSVPLPMVEEALDWKPVRIPRDVRDELTTLEARVVPVSDPAGAEPVMLPVRVPVRLPVPEVKKRLVVEALVAKKFVVVALVPVAFTKVKFWRVVEPVERRLASVTRPLSFTENSVVEALFATSNAFSDPAPEAHTVSRAYGVDVPTANLPPAIGMDDIVFAAPPL